MGYVNYGSVTAVGIVFPVLGLIALATRFYARVKYMNSKFEIDDILVVPAALLTVAGGVAMILGAQMRFVGGHTLDESQEEFLHTMEERQIMLEKFEYAFWIGHVLAIGFIKLTFLFFFRRIFKGRGFRTVFDYVNWSLIGLVTVWTIAYVFLEIFMCGLNFDAAWTTVYALRHYCMNTFALLTSCAITSFAMDLACLAVPLIMVSTLRMSFKRKLQASLVFALAIFSVTAGLLRMIVLIQVLENSLASPMIDLLGTKFGVADDEGVISLVLFWTYVEIGVGFLVVCLVACGRVFDDFSTPVIAKIKSIASSVASRASSVASNKSSSKSSVYSHSSNEKEETSIIASTKVEVRSEKRSEADISAVPDWLVASRRGTLDDIEVV
ncbi:hypothetical protein AC578_340 [Pseudocercospora eumusae]|uniref:Rhodopsin domain-containing protein n=1 Tax=Pseudocercospora eumusae TaxID=321146 RepID=A0A139HTY0_9PEZI|nr:hypothetical protein AC578_340 [Pseudocercospora eumusae]